MTKLFLKGSFTIFIFVLIGYFLWIYVFPKLNQKQTVESYLVSRVIDGDTFELDNKQKVRLLGIDSPELHQSEKLEQDAIRSGRDKKTLQRLGRMASDYMKNLVEGKKVRLEREFNYDNTDKYGRLLRYVYLEDGTAINRKMVEDGYAYAFRKYKISKLDEFIELEKEAREKKKGLWGDVEGLTPFDK